jgi:hypothetical protein
MVLQYLSTNQQSYVFVITQETRKSNLHGQGAEWPDAAMARSTTLQEARLLTGCSLSYRQQVDLTEHNREKLIRPPPVLQQPSHHQGMDIRSAILLTSLSGTKPHETACLPVHLSYSDARTKRPHPANSLLIHTIQRLLLLPHPGPSLAGFFTTTSPSNTTIRAGLGSESHTVTPLQAACRAVQVRPEEGPHDLSQLAKAPT